VAPVLPLTEIHSEKGDMKIPRPLLITGLIACSFFGLPAARGWCGDSPSVVFTKHQSSIMAQSRSQFEGYVFAVGAAEALTPKPSSVDRARDKARLVAQDNLIGPVNIDHSDWPERIRGSGVGDRIGSRFLMAEMSTVILKGLQSVYDECRGQQCLYVVAVPTTGIQSPNRIAWKHVLQTLEDRYATGSDWVSLFDYLEICAANQIDGVQKAIETYLLDNYGIGASAVIAGKPLDNIPVLWRQGKRFSAEQVSGLDQESLLQLLDLGPYDPVVLFYLARSFQSQGRHRFAALLYDRGTQWLIQPEYNQMCLTAIGKSQHSDRREANFFINEASLRDDIIASFTDKVALVPGITTLVVWSAGTLPLADKILDQTEVDIDLETIGQLVADYPTSKTFAALSEFFLQRGDPLSAVPFARQAQRMNDRYTGLRKSIEDQINKR
jgi:hypothetical protein